MPMTWGVSLREAGYCGKILAVQKAKRIKKMIVDSFTLFQELDLLELRLAILDPVVDRFVIAEGTRTFSGKPKELFFEANRARFAKWLPKIRYIVVDDWPDTDDAWVMENFQRNALARGWGDLADDDVVIFSDLDEIPNPEAVRRFAGRPGVAWFVQRGYQNFINGEVVDKPLWMGGSRMCSHGQFKALGGLTRFKYCKFAPRAVNEGPTVEKGRRMRDVSLIPNGGWHFSFLGGVDAIIRKIQAYSHQERNTAEFLDPERLMKALREGRSIKGSGGDLRLCPVEEIGLPDYALETVRKFPHFIAPVQDESTRARFQRRIARNLRRQKMSRRYIERLLRHWLIGCGMPLGVRR
ncbi:MAG: hypothetical protein ACI4RA_04225 [Kiritimatiellia bacterium]